jgi:lambda family phage portal protein
MTTLKSRRVPASEVLHIFRVDRPGQVRGVPWGAPVILRMKDFDEYEDAQLVRQKIAACFSAFVIPGDQYAQIAGINETDEEKLLPEKLEPGTIEILSDGKDVKFADPPSTSNYGEYSLVTLHEIATGYGVPYSVLTGDLRQVNFSSGRMGDRAFNRNLKHWQRNLIIPQLCQPVWFWFMEACVSQRLLPAPVPARWSPPRRELTDPAREIPALRDAARSGQMTMPELIRQNGFDPDDFLREIQEWNTAMDAAGVVLDSDPRKTSGAGLSQAKPGDSSLPPTSPEDNPDEE